MNQSAEVLLKLIRIALGKELEYSLPLSVDWKTVIDMSFEQGVAALAVDGLQRIYDSIESRESKEGIESLEALDSPELEDLKYEWFGEVMNCEQDYGQRMGVARKIARIWHERNIKAVVLKGASLAQYYPIPSHRYSCDLDLFAGEDWKASVEALKEKGVDVSLAQYKDAQFHLDGVYVENHRYITPLRGDERMQEFERYLRGVMKGSVLRQAQEPGCEIYSPSLLFNALFAVEHARGHLFEDKLTLRMVCDWMVLRRKVREERLEVRVEEAIDRFGFRAFYDCYDALADVVEGQRSLEDLTPVQRRVWDEMMESSALQQAQEQGSVGSKSLFARHWGVLFTILRSGWKYKAFNYRSMPLHLLHTLWGHFICRKVKL